MTLRAENDRASVHKRRAKMRGRLVVPSLLIAAVFGLSACAPGGGGPAAKDTSPIKIGAICDLTGATSDVGVPYCQGEKDYVEFINGQGGVNGRQINLISDDYAYQVPRAEELYNRLVNQEKVVAIMAWGTGDSEALRPKVSQDKIPFLSASYAEPLVADPKATPYNFMIGVTYSDQGKILVKYFKDNWRQAGSPRVQFVVHDSPFGKSPIEDTKNYGKGIGVEFGEDVIMPAGAPDLSPQMLPLKSREPDLIIFNNVAAPTAVGAKGARTAGLNSTLGTINWGIGETTLKVAGEAADGMLGAGAFAFLDEDKPGHKEMKEFNEKKGVDWTKHPINYVQGWVTMKVMLEGVKRVDGAVSGESLQKALETIKDFDTGGVTAPLTFSEQSHKGNLSTKIYKSDAKQNRWVALTDYIKMN
jgi:branched-chain amino acid transport system substrate-binding protein